MINFESFLCYKIFTYKNKNDTILIGIFMFLGTYV